MRRLAQGHLLFPPPAGTRAEHSRLIETSVMSEEMGSIAGRFRGVFIRSGPGIVP